MASSSGTGGPSFDRRIIVYPQYIDSNRTVAEGRIIPKDLACLAPAVDEMLEACKALNLKAQIEEKHYPRSWWIRGRLRVELKGADGKPANPEVPNRRTLLIKIAHHVTNSPLRKGKNIVVNPFGYAMIGDAAIAAAAAAAAAASGGAPAGGSSGTSAKAAASTQNAAAGNSKKKKGKK